MDYPETDLQTRVQTTKIKPIDSRETITDYELEEFVPIILNKEYYFPTQRVIASKLNEKMYSSRMNEKKAFTVSATLNTTNQSFLLLSISRILRQFSQPTVLRVLLELRADTVRKSSRSKCIRLL